MHLGFTELAIILAIVLVFVGPTQIPKLAKSIKDSKNLIREKEKSSDLEEQTENDDMVENHEQTKKR